MYVFIFNIFPIWPEYFEGNLFAKTNNQQLFGKQMQLIESQGSLCNAFCPCNPSLSASHSHHVHLRRSCTSCPSSPLQTSCISSPNTSAQRASRMRTGEDLQPCDRAPAVSGTNTYRFPFHSNQKLSFRWTWRCECVCDVSWALRLSLTHIFKGQIFRSDRTLPPHSLYS